MNYFPNTTLGRFRLVAVIEGISYLFLLFVAMPLKRIWGYHDVQWYTGWVHGILFLVYILYLIKAGSEERWSIKRKAWALIAALIPFVAFVFERRLYKEKLATLSEVSKA